MASTPTNTPEKKPDSPSSEEDVFMREVDEAVRVDEFANFKRKFGWPIAIILVLGLAAFAGYLFWDHSKESELETSSEDLILAIDEVEKGDPKQADEELALIVAEGSEGAADVAVLMRAGIAVSQDREEDAIALLKQVADDAEASQGLRDLAKVRMVALQFDDLDPQEVIDTLGPLATADSPFFGSAGELVAFAYLAQEKPEQAGPLLAAIIKDEKVPATLRDRLRDLAGSIGVDTIEDVDETLNELRAQASQQQAQQGAAAQ